MAGEWSGFEDGDLKLDFAGAIFNVHRAMFAQASPVWKAMLIGPFAESKENTIHFDGDDPQVARLCIELIYATRADSCLDWTSIESRVMSDRGAFDEFVDKYDVRGVKHLVAHELAMGKEKQQLKYEKQRQVRRLNKQEREVQRMKKNVGELRGLEYKNEQEVRRLKNENQREVQRLQSEHQNEVWELVDENFELYRSTLKVKSYRK